MVRRCCVQGCINSDRTILAHRFPKTDSMIIQWQKSLDLQRYSLEDLRKRFVVCTKHFSATSYRNEASNCLNTTAVPTLCENICNERSQKDLLKRAITTIELNIEGFNERLQPLTKRPKEDMQSEEIDSVVLQVEEEPETFELCEYDESAVVDRDEVSTSIDDNMELVTTDKNPVIEIDQYYEEISKCDQETQTDNRVGLNEPAVIQESIVQEKESKDDKLINILYPEYKELRKIQLIEILNDKNRKIETLEEKLKKLELAMRNLL